MPALEWSNKAGARIDSRACESCRAQGRSGKGKATWFPMLAGYWLPSDDPLGDRFGVCLRCREEWDRVWAARGLG